jgi:hypothetical protein
MEDLIKAHGWEMQEQNFLNIKDSKYMLSIIPEYSYFMRDETGIIHRSKEPQYLVLNCAIMSPNTLSGGDMEYRPVMYINITSEEEFYDFMIEISNTVNEEQIPNLETV